MNKERCEIEGCPYPAKYALNKTYPDGKKIWLNVCRVHEAKIGNENLRRAGGRYSRKEKERTNDNTITNKG